MFDFNLVRSEFAITLIYVHLEQSEITFGKFLNQCKASYKHVSDSE